MKCTLSFIAFFLLLYCTTAVAQSKLMLYQLDSSLPQFGSVNPAFFPTSKVIVGIPVLSGVHAGVSNSGIAFRDIFTRSGSVENQLVLDTARLPDKIRKIHRIRINAEIQLFYFGIRVKENYFSLGIHTVLDARISLPGGIVSWAIRGSSDARVDQNTLFLNSGNTNAQGLLYNQFSLGYSRTIIPDKLRVGGKIKYLMGIFGGHLKPFNAEADNDIDRIHVKTSAMALQITSLDFSDFPHRLFNAKNSGVAFDVGATYKLNDRFSFSASVLDLGFISWNDQNRTYQIDPVEYSFGGFDIIKLIRGDVKINDEFDKELTKLKDQANYREEPLTKAFTTNLIGKIYVGATYQIHKKHALKGVFYIDFFKGQANPAANLSYSISLGKVFNGILGVSYQDQRIDNFSLGFSVKLGSVQLYAATDALNSGYLPARASQANGQLGINLLFGSSKRKNIKPKIDTKSTLKFDLKLELNLKPKSKPKPEPTPKPKIVSKPTPKPILITRDLPRQLVIKKSDLSGTFAVGHYVIVGAFQSEDNAKRYSNALKKEGYDNDYAFLTEKNLHYVYVYKSDDLDNARNEVYRIRDIEKFEFTNAWILSIVE